MFREEYREARAKTISEKTKNTAMASQVNREFIENNKQKRLNRIYMTMKKILLAKIRKLGAIPWN